MQFDRNDFAPFFSDDVELTDVRYAGQYICKYFHFPEATIQRNFLARPTLKFSHKDDLNDPFELSKRWSKFGCPLTESVFQKHLRPRYENQLTDVNFMSKKLRDKARQNGTTLSRQQARRMLGSKEGRLAVERERQAGLEYIATMQKIMPQAFQDHEPEFIDSFARETGILSLTEDPNSPDMWREYAGGGSGFLLTLNAQHEFFSHTTGDGQKRKLLRQVFYRDDRIDDFWKNPNYLFLVKESKWKIEKEWRMIKSLAKCRKVQFGSNRPMYLVDSPPGLIHSITFGPNFPSNLISECASLLQTFSSSILINR